MGSSMSARKFVDRLKLDLDVTRRFTCPSCGGNNTFSVTKTLEGTKYFCFSASCNTRGVLNSTLSIEDMTKALEASDYKKRFEIPEYWVSGLTNSTTVAYLSEYRILDMCKEGRVDVRYDPKQDRLVFIAWKDGNILGSYGRSATKSIPKWLNYSATETPYIVQGKASAEKKTGCLVEDPVSAAAVSCCMDGISLLGTWLKGQYIPILSEYDSLIVALDKDAGEKSLDIQRILCYYTSIDIVLLERDLKYMSSDEIRETLDV